MRSKCIICNAIDQAQQGIKRDKKIDKHRAQVHGRPRRRSFDGNTEIRLQDTHRKLSMQRNFGNINSQTLTSLKDQSFHRASDANCTQGSGFPEYQTKCRQVGGSRKRSWRVCRSVLLGGRGSVQKGDMTCKTLNDVFTQGVWCGAQR